MPKNPGKAWSFTIHPSDPLVWSFSQKKKIITLGPNPKFYFLILAFFFTGFGPLGATFKAVLINVDMTKALKLVLGLLE